MRSLTKRCLVWVVIASALAVVTATVLRRSAEPSVRGKPLQHWLTIAAERSASNEGARTNAENAIKELGTSAVPFLLRQLQTPSGLRERFGPRWNRIAGNISYRLLVDLNRNAEFRELAVTGFEALGTNGASALPQLRQLTRDERYVADALQAIEHIKTDEALDVLIPLLSHSNPRIRSRTVWAITSFQDRKRVARAANELLRLTDDPDETTARAATSVVGDLLPADRAISVLTNKFHDPRPRVVQGALSGFFAAGPHAEPAMPLIALMLTNTDATTRRLATNVLLTINPYRAPEFGVDTNGLEERFYRLHRTVRQEFATNNVPFLRQ